MATEQELRNDRGRINCPQGLDPDYRKRECRNCGRQIAFFRARMTKRGWQKARWQPRR